jgi:predicted nucleic acid-binding protein
VIPGVFADSGPLLAAVDGDDQYHARAQAELAHLRRDGIGVVVAGSTLLETYTLVLRRLSIVTAHRWLAEIRRDSLLVVPTEADFDDAAEWLRRYDDQPLTLFDAVLAVLSRRSGVAVWTYDHHFDLMGLSVWR